MTIIKQKLVINKRPNRVDNDCPRFTMVSMHHLPRPALRRLLAALRIPYGKRGPISLVSLLTAAGLAALLGMPGCSTVLEAGPEAALAAASAKEATEAPGPRDEGGGSLPVGQPAKGSAAGLSDTGWDFEQIRARGVLRMATLGGANGYFLREGGDAGFEYELLREFSRGWNLRLEVVVPEPWETLVDLLSDGRADVAAADLGPDPEIEDQVAYTRPCNLVQDMLILPAGAGADAGWEILDGLQVWVPAGSGIQSTLRHLQQDLGYRLQVEPAAPGVTARALIAQVSRGEIPAAVVPARLAWAARAAGDNLAIGPELNDGRPVVWAVRRQSPALLAALDLFLTEQFQLTPAGPRRGTLHAVLTERYFHDDRALQAYAEGDAPAGARRRISAWDDIIRAAADSAGFDWRLLAAVIYEESRFDPGAVSPAGALGLMQVLPRAGGPAAARLLDPVQNVRAGVRLLREIHAAYAGSDSTDRWALTLATYHAGSGRLALARRAAASLGLDPDRWEGAVATGLLHVERLRAELGDAPFPGAATVAYVRTVMNRYDLYRRIVPGEDAGVRPPLAAKPPAGALASLASAMSPASPAGRPAG